ncbi:glycosyltransferase [Sphingomonas sp. M1-B02]|uniref:glycosyltransferase n=1 Tax=Sphingomonas sp. M1-B02 TaxID=3114300 RepID=UPI002240D96D|nr:glycosyltransferase [Sphingomonas sp. S6-11]UZK64901.1 glycosyltransferase [Sphingomonas sp. S6-11]
MRVVDVNEYYSPTGGGVRTYLDRKMGIMADLGHELIVLAPADEDSIEDRPGGGRIYWMKAPRLIVDKNYGIFVWDKPIWDMLDRLKPDVVEATSPWRPAWTVARWQGDAVKVFFAHNDSIGAYPQRWLDNISTPRQVERAFDWYSQYMNDFLKYYDAFVTNGPALAKRFRRRGQRVDASMPLGIERQWFSPDLRDEKLRVALLEQCGLPADGLLLLGLGRHHKEKRWPLVIDAVESAATDIPVGLILIGDGTQRRHLEQRIAGSPHIRIFRPVYDRIRLSRIMASCDALIHGSDAEPFGLVASEALASGLPLIGPDEGGFAEIADPLFAEIYASRDALSAADAIRRMYAREPAIVRAAARVAAGKVRSDHDHAVELMAYYEGLVAARRGAVATVGAA